VGTILLQQLLHRARARPEVDGIVRRDVDAAHDPAVGANVEHVDTGRRLLEIPEEDPLAGEGAREDGAVDAAVQNGENDVPGPVRQEAVDRSAHPLEQRRDRLPAEKARLRRDDVSEDAGEGLLELVLGDLGEAPRLELAEVRPRLRLHCRRNEGRRLERPRQPARHDPVEPDAGQRCSGRPGLLTALGRQRHEFGPGGPAVALEVRHLRVAHEVDPSPLYRYFSR